MTKQTKAQRLADALDRRVPVFDHAPIVDQAAAELRRLDANEAALLEALRKIAAYRPLTFAECSDAEAIMRIAESAIAKATGGKS